MPNLLLKIRNRLSKLLSKMVSFQLQNHNFKKIISNFFFFFFKKNCRLTGRFVQRTKALRKKNCFLQIFEFFFLFCFLNFFKFLFFWRVLFFIATVSRIAVHVGGRDSPTSGEPYPALRLLISRTGRACTPCAMPMTCVIVVQLL